MHPLPACPVGQDAGREGPGMAQEDPKFAADGACADGASEQQ